MTSAQFDGGAWIERVVELLPPLAQAQEPYLREFQKRYARVIDLRDGKPPPFPLDDLRLLYDEVRDSRPWGLEAHYAPLRAVLDPVHPVRTRCVPGAYPVRTRCVTHCWVTHCWAIRRSNGSR